MKTNEIDQYKERCLWIILKVDAFDIRKYKCLKPNVSVNSVKYVIIWSTKCNSHQRFVTQRILIYEYTDRSLNMNLGHFFN